LGFSAIQVDNIDDFNGDFVWTFGAVAGWLFILIFRFAIAFWFTRAYLRTAAGLVLGSTFL